MPEIKEESFLERLSQLFPKKQEELWQRFVTVGLPDKDWEVYRYVRLKDLYDIPLKRAVEPILEMNIKPCTLVLINGCYKEALSNLPKGIIALPFSKAEKTYGAFFKGRQQKILKEEKDPFALLNGALHQEGLFLYIPPSVHLEEPLHVIHYIEGEEILVSPRIFVVASKNTSLNLFMTQKQKGKSLFNNSFIDFSLEEHATVTFVNLQKEEESSWHFDSVRAFLKKESHFRSFTVTKGAKTSRQDFSVKLQGAHARADLKGIWKLSNLTQHHVNVYMEHEEPDTTSIQTFKGVLLDAAKSSFEGKIYVRPKAQKTQSYQLNQNLVLGEKAAAYSKPNLEIFADDVKASHGATVGKLNEESLFYLKTRGVPRKMAEELLIQGFLQEIVEKMPLHLLKPSAYSLIQ